MATLSQDAFEELVQTALDGLPADLAAALSNVEIVVQAAPGPEAAAVDLAPGSFLLGLYTGIPLTRRGGGYAGALPDLITIYQDNIERTAGSVAAIPEAVRRTVIHELGHHFGIGDDRLHALGW